MKKLIIIGAGGLGREVAWLTERINQKNKEWDLLGFIDDSEDVQNKKINGYDVLGTIDEISRYSDAFFVCAVGAAKVREKIINKVKQIMPLAKFAVLVDPSVEISSLVEIGEGTIICGNSFLTVNIKIGEHVIINFGCTVGHDAVLQDFVTLYPGVNISGSTNIGHTSEMGTGSQIIQGKAVGNQTIVGAGAVITKDIPEKCTAVGIPAKPIKFFE